jgi:hypothetical protein
MATTVDTQITVTSSGDGIDSEWKPTAMANPVGAAGGPVRTTLASGDNSLSVPTGARGFVLAPPAVSNAILRLKHYSGETGFALRPGEPSAIPIPSGTTSVMVNASAVTVAYVHWT